MPGGHFLEKSTCRGTPRVICTTHIVANRWGAVGERVMLSGLDILVCRVRWPVGYGEEREASHTCAAAALAKLADRPIPIAYALTREPSENTTTVGIPNVWTIRENRRKRTRCTW
jgi:hypothetical protein